MLKYLLDTNIVIYVIKRRPIEVMGIFNENAGRMAISAITLSELFHGAEKSAKVAQNLAVVEEFASLLEVLPYTAKASQHYGAIRSALEKVGPPNRRERSAHRRPCAQRRAHAGDEQPRRVRARTGPADRELGRRPAVRRTPH
jgi:predicted nucleic acid-binding protein